MSKEMLFRERVKELGVKCEGMEKSEKRENHPPLYRESPPHWTIP
jgi:hypothetical protein